MMSETDALVLVGAPYSHPRCWVGCMTFCRRRNMMVMVDELIGPLSWPASRDSERGGHSLSIVVNDELIRAATTNGARAFAYWFGSSLSVWYNIKSQFAQPVFPDVNLDELRPLMFAPYSVPTFNRGDLTTCIRLGAAKITSSRRGPLKWPRCLPYPNVGSYFHRQPSLLVTDELVRALKNESGLGFAAWFGVHVKTYSRLRQDLGIKGSTPGFRALHRIARNERIAKLNLRWTEAAISILGTAPDSIIAHQLGVRIAGVTNKRLELKIPAFRPPPKPRKPRRINGEPVFIGRSPDWADFRAEFLTGKTCAACGGSDFLTLHHIRPFHMFPDLEFVESNLIVLCTDELKNCHHRIGHNFDWYSYNPHVVEDAALSLSRIQNKPNRTCLAETA